MSLRFWIAAGVLVAGMFAAGSAGAQYRGYGNDQGYDFYADPGNGGGSAYQPFFYYPNGRTYRQPRAYEPQRSDYGNGYDQGPAPQPLYVDPSDANRDQRDGGPRDLGVNADRRTVTEVPNPTRQPPGTIVIDTASRHLYYTQPDGQALRYGIGVGRQGFAWKGTAKVQRKAEWPAWIPPSDMLKRRPDLPLRMEGGIDNPLGARALYLFQGNRDTMFRIHGTNEPDTIGQAVSSGCIRMMNADVIDLYERVPVGTKVVVL